MIARAKGFESSFGFRLRTDYGPSPRPESGSPWTQRLPWLKADTSGSQPPRFAATVVMASSTAAVAATMVEAVCGTPCRCTGRRDRRDGEEKEHNGGQEPPIPVITADPTLLKPGARTYADQPGGDNEEGVDAGQPTLRPRPGTTLPRTAPLPVLRSAVFAVDPGKTGARLPAVVGPPTLNGIVSGRIVAGRPGAPVPIEYSLVSVGHGRPPPFRRCIAGTF